MPNDLERIHHVAIPVNNIQETVDWYLKTANCEVSYQDKTWAMLKFANISVALVLPEQHPAHLCLLKEDAESYGELRAHRDGTRSVYIQDPTGNAVEIMAKDRYAEEY